MYVFIDDSGDAGMKFGQGSSRYLVMAACVFSDAASVENAANALRACRKHLGHSDRWEFKHSKADEHTKDVFSRAIEPLSFNIRAIVIDKTTLYSDMLTSHPSELKSYAIMQLLTHTYGAISDASVRIDGRDTKAFNRATESYLRKKVNEQAPGTIRRVRLVDSQVDIMIQMADMVAGTIYAAQQPPSTGVAARMAIVTRKARHPAGSIWRFR